MDGKGGEEGDGGAEKVMDIRSWVKSAAALCCTFVCCLKTLVFECLHIRVCNAGKLKTKEDPFHVHKCLGMSCLVHIAYRSHRLFRTGTTGLQQDNSTPACLALHAALNLTSFVFHLPKNRVKGRPVIYPEFRLHSSIFAGRSIICALLLWWNPTCSTLLRGGVCLLAMKLADMATERYGDSTIDTTIRGMPYPVYISERVRYVHNLYYAGMQAGATVLMFCTNTPDDPFFVLVVVQFAPFLMTLVRKSIISGPAWHLYYTGSSFYLILSRELLWDFSAIFAFPPIPVALFFLWFRVAFRWNKYILWCLTIFACVLLQRQPHWHSLHQAQSAWRLSQPTNEYVVSLAKQKDFLSLEALLGMYPNLVRAQSHDNLTLLHYGVADGRMRFVKRCLLCGLPVDGYLDDQPKVTPLLVAALGNRLNLVNLLLRRGANASLVLSILLADKGRYYDKVSMAVREALMKKLGKRLHNESRVLDAVIPMAIRAKGNERYADEVRSEQLEL
eukprot:TRINITY_DN2966_c0_g4_i2.p1 TRINITY_DN2966_c0_g4~~TRINITY_DN2966_c0_g4_i2.p1  ORF type:complete len:502 (+),score=13.45 TRINITY_DN2966_c0_g4_i2:71-1576(+)